MKQFTFIIFLSFALFLFSRCSQQTGPGVTQSADGLEIHYTVYGTGDPAIVLIHGWMCDQTYWKNQVDQFSDNYTVITVDLGGHGESGLNRSHWTMDSFVEDVVAVIQKVQPENVILAGHSLGGFVALEAAPKIADKIKGLILVDSFHEEWWPLSDSEKNPVFESYSNDFKNYVYGWVYDDMFPPDADTAIRHQIAEDMSSGPPEVGIGAIEDYWSGDYTETITKVVELKVPVILINTEFWPTDLEKMNELGFEVLTMDDVGHFLMLEDPDRFNILLDEALKIIADS
jgi:pimeloyl-ACP methyl ester carboxylesterase